jgi:hypothetical protein
VLPKQIKQADVTRMLFQLRLVTDRRGEERISFTPMPAGADLLPANEAAMVKSEIVVTPPAQDVPAAAEGIPVTAAPAADIAILLPQLSLEIRAALDTSLQKEIAALRGYLGTALSAQAERLHGDLAVLLPAPRTPDFDLPTMMPERRPWGAISGWTLALVAGMAAAFFYWSWWTRGNEVAVLRSDLSAAQSEVDALRARPEVVSPGEAPAAETFIPTDGSTPAVAETVAPLLATDAAATPVAAAAMPAAASASALASGPANAATPVASATPRAQ